MEFSVYLMPIMADVAASVVGLCCIINRDSSEYFGECGKLCSWDEQLVGNMQRFRTIAKLN